MEIENSYQNTIVIRDHSRNKFAIMSFVISLVTIILSPFIIPQIIGIVFSVLGMKSEKKGLSIAGMVINIFTILFGILILISTISINMFGGVVSNARIKADQNTAIIIQTAIVDYIGDTGDFDLRFEGNKTVTVEKLISNLKNQITIENKSYGPYLKSASKKINEIELKSPKYKGWRIVVKKGESTVEVQPTEAEDYILIE